MNLGALLSVHKYVTLLTQIIMRINVIGITYCSNAPSTLRNDVI